MRPATTGHAAGMTTVASTKIVQMLAGTDGNVHAAISVAAVNGADSVRRRLSIIFHRENPGIGLWRRFPVASRAVSRIHGNSCQSPRAQRCWRVDETR